VFSNEGTIDVANATYDKVKNTLKKIASPHAFVENEQWNVVRMKEEFCEVTFRPSTPGPIR
jgi:hypothetical protein